MIDHVKLTGTTTSGGAATITHTIRVAGKLLAVEWIDGDLADGVDAVLSVTGASSGVQRAILTLTNANTDAMYYPHVIMHDNTGTAVTFDGTNEIYAQDVFDGILDLVIASGGDTKTGGCIVYFER